MMIFDQNYLIFLKKPHWSKFGSMSKHRHNIYFSPFGGNIVRQADEATKALYWKIIRDTFYKILIAGQIIENENTYPPPPHSVVTTKFEMFF